MEIGTEGVGQGQKTRRLIYWITSVLATLVYVVVVLLLLIVPGVEPTVKIWLLLPLGVLLATPLAIGVWRFKEGGAPISIRPFGQVVGVVLSLELAHCVIGLVAQVFIILRKH